MNVFSHHKLSLTLVFVFFIFRLYAQNGNESSEQIKPDWAGGEGFKTDFYDYYVGYAESDTLQTARTAASKDALVKIATKMNVSIDVSSISELKTESVQNGGNEIIKSDYNFKGTVKERSQTVTIAGLRSVDSYYSKTGSSYQYWILIRKPLQTPDPDLKSFTYSEGHIWRSVLLPGWGQLHLGYRSRGTVLITTTAVLVAGAITSQLMYNTNYDDYTNSLKTGHPKDAEVYKSNADTWFVVRNINLVALSGVYIYNLIDVFTKKGTKVFAINKRPVDVFPTYCYNTAQITFRMKL
jgi:hypothetical protein